MTKATDAAMTRRVTGARLVAVLAVLGGTLALSGTGAFGDLTGGTPAGDPGIVTVELSEAVSTR
jgi:hypothetical protein